ncbi:type VI secretion lipoprotein TssJ [Cupriavidus sp. IDO]|uniref:type VI secretion lipoprotein TssJ n=1 Tax=Cupriavidus sp. IDO TaxID=1539142 RepID=UPI00068A1DAB|nr:type VI secretion lipoprotein TssJ [Cupriavidus sp. IDO]KWR92081.1 hypothetical protein RM96_00880 [Cupriavidus sp. IDO]
MASDACPTITALVPQVYLPEGYAQALAKPTGGNIAGDNVNLSFARDAVLRPNARVSLNEPMHADAEYVSVVAFFLSPDKDVAWKLVVPKRQWRKTDPVRIAISGSSLELAASH